jgi:hypothetical protein
MLISFLNSYEQFDDWKLRSTFFQYITDVLGYNNNNNYSSRRPLVDIQEMTSTLLTCIEDGLRDSKEIVVQSAFKCLIRITKQDDITTDPTAGSTTATIPLLNMKHNSLKSLIESVVPFLLHPTTTIRNSSIEFLSILLATMDIGIARSLILPKVVPFLSSGKFIPFRRFI